MIGNGLTRTEQTEREVWGGIGRMGEKREVGESGGRGRREEGPSQFSVYVKVTQRKKN